MPELNVTNDMVYILQDALYQAGAMDNTTNGIYHTLYNRLKDYSKDDFSNLKLYSQGTLTYSKEELPYIIKALENESRSIKSKLSEYQYNAKHAQDEIKQAQARIVDAKKDIIREKDNLKRWNTTVKNTNVEIKGITNLISDIKKTNRTTTKAPKSTKLPSNKMLNQRAFK